MRRVAALALVATAVVLGTSPAGAHNTRIRARIPLHDASGRPAGYATFSVATDEQKLMSGYLDGALDVHIPKAWRGRIVIRGGTCTSIPPVRANHIEGEGPDVVIGDVWSDYARFRWAIEVFRRESDRLPALCGEHHGSALLDPGNEVYPAQHAPARPRRTPLRLVVPLIAPHGGAEGTSVVTAGSGGFTVRTTLHLLLELDVSHTGPFGEIRRGTCERLVAGDRPIPLSNTDADNALTALYGDDFIKRLLAPLIRVPRVIEYYHGWDGFGVAACGVLSA